MRENKEISAQAVETAHFETGTGEVAAPPGAAGLNHAPGETYTFSMPESPVPRWVHNMVAKKWAAINMDSENTAL